MEEELEIILRAVDDASSTFESVSQSANSMGESLQEAFENATAEVERLEEELAQAHLDGDDIQADIIADELAEAEAEAERLSEALASMDSSGISDASSETENLTGSLGDVGDSASQASDGINGVAESGEGAGESMDSMTAAADAFTATALLDFAQQVSDTLWNLADSAGTVRDSMDRASLEAEGFGLSAESMKGTLSDVADETGRAGGQIRESFIKATARGVTDMDAFKKMMEGAGAQAYLLGTDIQSMGNKFSSMAQKDTLMSRALAETGVTMAELATAMGMTGATADEVKAKWKELDTNQRAAILGTAASMNEGKDANEHYKNSWEGLQAQVDKAKAKLEVMVGNVLLPVLIPALELAGRVLDWFGDALGTVMDGPLGGFISVIGGLGGAIAIAVPAIAALTAAIGFFEVTIWPAVAATWALISPLLPFIAIGAAVVLIIYEIGKALGWWSDASSMIDAVWAGIQRLWSAFINHPDVQAAIQAISSALQTLWGYIQQAGQAIMEFFGISTGGEFDVVRALIDGIGMAWEAVTHHIRFAIEIVMAIVEAISSAGDAFGSFYEDTLAPFGEWLSGVFAPVWQLIGDLLNAIAPFVSNLTNAFTLFANGQMDLPGLVWTVLTTLFNAYVTIFSLIMSRVTSWGISLISKGLSVASNFVSGVVNWLRQLPGRALSALLQVVSSIISAGSQWVSNATSQASNVVSGVVSRLSSLPGQISSALSGVVDAIVSPFRSAYDAVCGVVDSIKSKVQEGLSEAAQLTGFGGDNTAAGGDHFSAYGNDILPNATTYSVGSGSVEVSGEVTERLILDFQNVPQHIDTVELIEAMKDRRVLETIARSSDFQSIDTKVKNEIIGKSKRFYGV